MKLWRIAAETRDYPATDLSGGGAAKRPGRWNAETEAVLYCAPTIAMAVLETAAHIDDAGLPLDRFVVELNIPDAVWGRRKQLDVGKLPATWAAIPAGQASVKIGSKWLASRSSAILLVPSVIVPDEHAALINPLHTDAKLVSATAIRRFEYNRLRRK